MYGKSVTETVQLPFLSEVMILLYLSYRGHQTPKVTGQKCRKVYRDDTVNLRVYVYSIFKVL